MKQYHSRFDNTQSIENMEEWKGSKSSFFCAVVFFVSEIQGFFKSAPQKQALNCFLLQNKPKKAAEKFFAFI